MCCWAAQMMAKFCQRTITWWIFTEFMAATHSNPHFNVHLAWQNVRDLLRNRHLKIAKREFCSIGKSTRKKTGDPRPLDSHFLLGFSVWPRTFGNPKNSETRCFGPRCRFSEKPHRFQLLIHQKTFGDIFLTPRSDNDNNTMCSKEACFMSK